MIASRTLRSRRCEGARTWARAFSTVFHARPVGSGGSVHVPQRTFLCCFNPCNHQKPASGFSLQSVICFEVSPSE